jgi:hypothetical protein
MILRLFKAALAAVGGLTASAPGNILERLNGTHMLDSVDVSDGGGRGGGRGLHSFTPQLNLSAFMG